jgi:hypothetical protein
MLLAVIRFVYGYARYTGVSLFNLMQGHNILCPNEFMLIFPTKNPTLHLNNNRW